MKVEVINLFEEIKKNDQFRERIESEQKVLEHFLNEKMVPLIRMRG